MYSNLAEIMAEALLHENAGWCIEGSLDDWIPLAGAAEVLSKQVKSYVPDLDQESYFELI